MSEIPFLGVQSAVENQIKRQELAAKVNGLLPQIRKEHLALKVKNALIAAAQADPIHNFDNCECGYHQDVHTTEDSLVASIIWK